MLSRRIWMGKICIFLIMLFAAGSSLYAETISQCQQLTDKLIGVFAEEKIIETKRCMKAIFKQCSGGAKRQRRYLAKFFPTPPKPLLCPTDDGLIRLKDEIYNNYSELNAIATAYFIRGQLYEQQGRYKRAIRDYKYIIKTYPYAYLHGNNLCLWNIAYLASDRIDLMNKGYSYEDYNPHLLIRKSWVCLNRGDMEGALLYANKCIELYTNTSSKNILHMLVVAHYILGEVYLSNKDEIKAKREFEEVLKYPETMYPNTNINYPYFNNITQKARDRITLMGTGYDFGNYTSQTLTVKAWKAWDRKDYDGVYLYTMKCIELWSQKAKQMQKNMTGFAKPGFVPFYWALNDVGTCYFILAMSYQQQGKIDEACKLYNTIIKDYGYAQCWDPKGHYWKVAEVSKERLQLLQLHNTCH